MGLNTKILCDCAAAQTQITETQAKEIALKHAELSKADVTHTHVHQDFDDEMEQFDVTFYVRMTEYNYDINVNTGTIIDFDAEIDD